MAARLKVFRGQVDTLRMRRGSSTAAGFTLVELLVVISIMGVLSTIAVAGFQRVSSGQSQQNAVNGALELFRGAQTKAVAEGRTYCVRLDDAKTLTVWRYSCDPAETTLPSAPEKRETFTVNADSPLSASFTASSAPQLAHSCPGTMQCAFFYPRGIASSGTLNIGRSSGVTYTLNVVGLTGRVYVTH